MMPYRLIEFAELDSTNRYACAQLAQLAHGDVIQAGVQAAGRGRRERRWISHLPGNLCLSLVLKPTHAAPAALPLVNLSQLLALSTCQALDAYGVPAALKWPNDIQVCGRKIAGILAETVQRGDEFLGVVLGIGVNLNLDAAALASIDQPATSLAIELKRPVNVAGFRDALLQEFFNRYEEFLARGFSTVRSAYLERCPFLGVAVEIRCGNEIIQGTASAITLEGALELALPDGGSRTVTIGEMFLRSPD